MVRNARRSATNIRAADDALESEQSSKRNCPTQLLAAGFSRRPSTSLLGSQGFVGYGDADPSNVSSLVHGAEMRVAETRAVNRALRKAYGIGLCSVEELGWAPRPSEP